MKRITKLGLSMAAVGGTLMMAAPAAFADDLSGFQAIGAGTYQTQDGAGAGDAILNQNSSIQLGQVQAADYYNNINNFGFQSATNNYSTTDGTNGSSASTWDNNFGGNQTTTAENFSQQQAQVTQSQSQLIGNWTDTYNYDESGDLTSETMSGGTGGQQEQGGGVVAGQDANSLLGLLFAQY